ncbi:Reactivating factor of Adenosylcobalamin-dependent ethanolamine ammonia lyase [Pseudomonas delhiensis]|uniref:Reactivating factor of Adenosylcobalamin-dependent ethanolamine ammonia lyase n=1 Tax=Pseudomonas delhiensis TaxID=366289 RepID=A0A239ECT6_9PSED|nr:ethanolamine ammonia-lyase reactivating factor EutA [Pseudomonas delhiensis]SDI31205.1 Reactivating factor of Adenosylcobalamin-dependent ethanolamine ammonia lyase [Pseudomonas delhiensis]SNS42495.1 Reactivating factor of Adenosylcobalamin-dependent ethanolamine ammonia lyase [Pseudomonas delhiensis]
MSRRELRSVGIDVGTTTTQVIFSRLVLVNRASLSQVPHYEFAAREVTYVSPVAFTPIDFEGHLREEELLAFILDQYRAAELAPEQVESGAIIITGETSKARNARPAVLRLAERLGDFVVASAGPHLESVIAGRGAGAAELSADCAGRVLNIDIGGGTANYVLFEAGRVIGSACLNVGGRLVETDSRGALLRLHAPARAICRELFGSEPQTLSGEQLRALARRMAALLFEVIDGTLSPLARELLMTEPLPAVGRLQALTLSGGVGECYYHGAGQAPFRFGDIGPLLAEALHGDPGFQRLPLVEPKQTVRATVIGAGAHSLSLSGSTIWLREMQLPMRNVPVVPCATNWAGGQGAGLADGWLQNLLRMDLRAGEDLYALALPADLPVAYQAIQRCVEELAGFQQRNPSPHPLLVVAVQDLGKVLGMLLQPRLAGRALAVIDEVATSDGDYIDIGSPLFDGEILPVTVKSLAFPS